MVSLESDKRSNMRRLTCLTCVFASFWTLGAAPGVLAQGVATESEVAGKQLPVLSELKIVRSSRTDVPGHITVEIAEIPAEPTRILDQQGAERLIRNEGASLQWISWEERGPVWVGVTETGHWSLLAGQEGSDGGLLDLEGFITEIGKDYFIFEGTIKMLGTPDKERQCNTTKQWRFAVTQNRSYYRLREFEWCDYLTDYIDIYFPPSLR